jgi:hypothetical protein
MAHSPLHADHLDLREGEHALRWMDGRLMSDADIRKLLGGPAATTDDLVLGRDEDLEAQIAAAEVDEGNDDTEHAALEEAR